MYVFTCAQSGGAETVSCTRHVGSVFVQLLPVIALKFVEPVSWSFSICSSLNKLTDIKLNVIALKTYLHFWCLYDVQRDSQLYFYVNLQELFSILVSPRVKHLNQNNTIFLEIVFWRNTYKIYTERRRRAKKFRAASRNGKRWWQ